MNDIVVNPGLGISRLFSYPRSHSLPLVSSWPKLQNAIHIVTVSFSVKRLPFMVSLWPLSLPTRSNRPKILEVSWWTIGITMDITMPDTECLVPDSV